MADDPVELDRHRGMAAQKQTDIRRRLADVQADQAALRFRQKEFEDFLESTPAVSAQEAVTKAKYLLQLYAATPDGADPRRARLIARTLEELDRIFKLSADVPT
ncbi:MAG: hypothetical protein SFV21_02565 [Rhodospirillaceae bacterium]|nr:hypothetical protein [Rhodospirillaceae bacterium]